MKLNNLLLALLPVCAPAQTVYGVLNNIGTQNQHVVLSNAADRPLCAYIYTFSRGAMNTCCRMIADPGKMYGDTAQRLAWLSINTPQNQPSVEIKIVGTEPVGNSCPFTGAGAQTAGIAASIGTDLFIDLGTIKEQSTYAAQCSALAQSSSGLSICKAFTEIPTQSTAQSFDEDLFALLMYMG